VKFMDCFKMSKSEYRKAAVVGTILSAAALTVLYILVKIGA
jgi:hypothetical protein